MAAKRIKVKAWACKCDREPCGHEWVTLTDQKPKVCPKCKALTWDRQTFVARKPKDSAARS